MSERPAWATWVTFRGQRLWYLDALMLLDRQQLDECEAEVEADDGTVTRVRVFKEYDPPFGRDDDGILGF